MPSRPSDPAPRPPPARRPRPADMRLLGIVLSVTGVYLVAYLAWLLPQESWTLDGADNWIGNDFFVFWAAARHVLSEGVAGLYDVSAFTAFQLSLVASESLYYPWVYPPHGLFVVLPFGLLPYAGAYVAWLAATFAVFVLLGGIGRPRLATGLMLAMAPATVIAASAGQNAFLTAGLFVGSLLLLHRRPVLAGVLMGLLSFKPQIALLLPLAVLGSRSWRALWAAAATGGLVALASLAVFGPGAWADFLAALPGFQATMAGPDGAPLMRLQPTVTAFAGLLGWSADTARLLQGGVAVLVGAVVLWVYRRGRDPELQAACAAFGALLVTPYALVYDLPVVALGVVLATRHGLAHGFARGQRPLLILAWLLPVATMPLADAGLPIAPAVLLALLLVTARRALDRTVDEVPSAGVPSAGVPSAGALPPAGAAQPPSSKPG